MPFFVKNTNINKLKKIDGVICIFLRLNYKRTVPIFFIGS